MLRDESFNNSVGYVAHGRSFADRPGGERNLETAISLVNTERANRRSELAAVAFQGGGLGAAEHVG